MSSYKVTYFNITGLGEPIRFLLSYLNVDFEDIRIDLEQWPALKPNMPFGKVPTLEIDGKILTQSTAITRYLSKKAGLAGSDDWESLLIDIAVDNIDDLQQALASYAYDLNEASKEAKYAPLINETIPFYMNKFEKIVEENNGYFVNGKLSWADLFFVAGLDYSNFMAKIDLLEGYPKLKALNEKVLALPQIKSWIAKRPLLNDYLII